MHARESHEKAIRNIAACLEGSPTLEHAVPLVRRAFKELQLGLRHQGNNWLTLHQGVYTKLRSSIYELRFSCDATEWERKQAMIFFIRGCKAFAVGVKPRCYYASPHLEHRDMSAIAAIDRNQQPLRQPLRLLARNSTSRLWTASEWPQRL